MKAKPGHVSGFVAFGGAMTWPVDRGRVLCGVRFAWLCSRVLH